MLQVRRFVKRGSLVGNSANAADQRFHPLQTHLLPVSRAGGAGDALVDQSPPQIVDSRVEAGFHAFRPHLHPRGLDVREMGIQDEPGGCSERLKAYLLSVAWQCRTMNQKKLDNQRTHYDN